VDPDEAASRLVDALAQLDQVANSVTPDEAPAALDDASLQVFWRDWPQISAWAGALWRRLDQDLARPARPQGDADLDEVGGSG
jgi:hypothetical protein